MKFSVGGHLFFAAANKSVHVFNSYTLVRLATVGTFPLGVAEIVLGDKDQTFSVVSPDGQVCRYRTLPRFEVIRESVEKQLEFRSVCFVQDPTEDTLLAVAGSDGFKAALRLVNARDHLVASFAQEEGRYSQVAFVKTNRSKVTGLVVGSDKGALSVFAYPFVPRALDVVSAHAGEVTRLALSADGRFLFSAGADGSVFVFSLGEQSLQEVRQAQLGDEDKLDDGAGGVVDEALADVVLVKKPEMEEW